MLDNGLVPLKNTEDSEPDKLTGYCYVHRDQVRGSASNLEELN